MCTKYCILLSVELAQLLLVTVVSILTLLLVVVGFQALLILRDFRKTVKKLNNVLEDAHSVSSSIAKPIAGTGNILESFRQMKNMVDYVSSAKSTKGTKSTTHSAGSGQESTTSKEEIQTTQVFLAPKPQARVFKRNGRPLTS